MKTILQKHGAGYLLELDGKTLEEWMIDPSEPMEVSAVGGVITVVPMGTAERKVKIDAALDDVFERYGETFKRLAE